MTVTTRITTPFTAQSTAAEVVAGVDLSGRRAIVTGGASGIGIETARALAGGGTEVTLAAFADVVGDVVTTVSALADRAEALGVRRDGILVDPAHDFGKNTRHSLELTRRLDALVAALRGARPPAVARRGLA